MQTRERRNVRLALILALSLAVAGSVSLFHTVPEVVQAEGQDIYVPVALQGFEGPYPTRPTVEPATNTPEATTPAGPTRWRTSTWSGGSSS